VTRNEADFRASSLLIYSPAQFLAALALHKAEGDAGKPSKPGA
jgi:hypothetical protein